jgi:proteasome lid subunit RPN8/RPN11
MAQVADRRVCGDVELVLSQEHLEQILEHARTEAPNEACGLLAGRDRHVTHVLAAANVAENPQVRYLMDPHEQIHHFHMIEEQGLDLLGIYHSHPISQAYPSPTDLSMAYYPDAVYAIVSLAQNDNPDLRAFRMVDGQVLGVTVQVVPSPFSKTHTKFMRFKG